MSDDLISRKAVIDILENMIFEVGKDLSKSYLLQDARERIIGLNTAFDKEKVIAEIQNQLELSDTCAYESDYPTEVSYYKGRSLGHEIDIEIVEKGGIK